MTMPRWSSTLKHFCWCEASSDGARLSAATTACVPEVSPTQALPCFTDSMAYSTWKRRPCGDHVETSVSAVWGVREGRSRAG